MAVAPTPAEPVPAAEPAPEPAAPPGVKAVLRRGKILILEQVHFATAKFLVLPDSYALLNKGGYEPSENSGSWISKSFKSFRVF